VLKPYRFSLEAVIRRLSRENNVVTFHFVTYAPSEADSDELDPAEVKPYELIPVPASYFHKNRLSNLVQEHCDSAEKVLGIASNVLVRKNNIVVPRHIVQLDIDGVWPDLERPALTYDDMPSVIAHAAAGLCNQSGCIVISSKDASFQNFHFYGKKVVTHQEWGALMRKSQASIHVDSAWPEYSLARGYSVLRVSANKDKPSLPVPIGHLVT